MKPRDGVDLVLLAALWGASFLLTRVATPVFGAFPLAALRVGAASGAADLPGAGVPAHTLSPDI